MNQQAFSDTPVHHLFIKWCRAEYNANLVLHEVSEDMLDQRYIEAEQQAHKALFDFICNPTRSLFGILLKLKVACQFDDYVSEALDPSSKLVSPRAIVAAKHDLESVVIACFGAEGVKQQDEELDAVMRAGVSDPGEME
jgi:hypothetical protein